MIITIRIGFHEPYTGVWVEGKNEYYFSNEKDIKLTCDRWREALKLKYHDSTAEVCTCDPDFN